MHDASDIEIIQRVAKATVAFFQGKRRGPGSPAEQIAAMSDIPSAWVRRVFDEHWGIRSIHDARLNMTKLQYERILAEATSGVALSTSVSLRSAPAQAQCLPSASASEPGAEPHGSSAVHEHFFSALAREVDAADLSQQQKADAKQLLSKLAEAVGPAVLIDMLAAYKPPRS